MNPKSVQGLRLRTFGALVVTDAQGEPVLGIAPQRRLLALLSVVAVAGDTGVTRDRIAALLWPESTAERAGQSITQALYSARRLLATEDLFVTSGELRLNGARITSDTQEFEAALAAGSFERAVDLYTGAFLDGFFLASASEFERWSSAQRTRYEDRYADALRQLAEAAEQANDLRRALDCWKRLAAARPLDASIAVSLMQAMARTGDRAGAIRHAAAHASMLRHELELDPDPVVSAMAERLRRAASWSTPPEPELDSSSLPGGAGARGNTAGADLESGDRDESMRESAQPPAPRPAPSRVRRSLWLATASLLIGGIGVSYAAVVRRSAAASAAPIATLHQRVVVAPFRVSGASASLSYLREGLVELLSETLADDSASRSVDAGAVLSAWRRAGALSDEDLPRDSIVRLAAALGADHVIIGNVVGTPHHAVLSATMVDVADDRAGPVATAEGIADSVSRLVDRLTARLLVQQAGEEGALSGQASRSLPAVRAFLAGQAAFRRGAYDDALRAYDVALQHDSTFALAALQMVRAGDRLQAIAIRGAPLALAWRWRRTLATRDRALLEALAGPRYPLPATDAEQLAAWERLVALTPDRAEAWYELGARMFHSGAVLGLPDARQRSADALRRALSLDSAYAPARRLLVLLAATDTSGRLGVPPLAVVRDSSGSLAPAELWRLGVQRGDTSMLDAMRDTMARLGPANLRVIAQESQFDVVGLDDGRRALDILRSRPARPSERLEQAEALHSLAVLQGRVVDARATAARLRELQPGSHAGLRLEILDALYGDGDAGYASSAVGRLASEESVHAANTPGSGVRAADICVLGQWRAAHGDSSGTRRDLMLLQAATVERRPSGDATAASLIAATPPATCALLLQGSLASAHRGAGALRVLARLDSLALIPPVAGDASTYAPILIARLHARLGDVTGALAAVRRRVYLMGWPRYLATALREEARYAELAGDVPEERAALTRFVALRQSPDSTLQPGVAAARQRLRALADISTGR